MNTPPTSPLDLDDLLRKLRDLPTLPEVAHTLLRNLDDEQTSLDQLAEQLALDPSLTAKLIRLANSSFYGANSKVVTLQQAIALLGVKNVQNLVRMTLIVHNLPMPHCPGFDFHAFWKHGIATAVCAELISRLRHMRHDFAFTAGLLHDLGQLLLASQYPRRYAAVLAHQRHTDCSLLFAERTLLGIDHTEAGLALARHWQFSEALCDAIRGHHTPDDDSLNTVALVVHVANCIVHGLDIAETEGDLVPLLSDKAWGTLALSDSECLSLFRETELRSAALIQLVT